MTNKIFCRQKSISILITVLLTVVAISGAGAQKVEVEKKINKSEFPAVAIEWLNENYEGFRKVSYFKEIDSDTINYEAKFCWGKERYSIEFLKGGSVKDIEKEVKFTNLPTKLKEAIGQRLDADFRKWKVARCQEQTLPNSTGKRFEIEIKGKDDTGAVLYEYLFEEDGAVVQKRKVVLPSNLINQY